MFARVVGLSLTLCACVPAPPQDPRSAALSAVLDRFSAADALLTAPASLGPQALVTSLRGPFLPKVLALVGASGSGRGEFARKYVCLFMCACLCVCAVCLCVSVPVCVCVYVPVCVCECGRACVCVPVFVCVPVCLALPEYLASSSPPACVRVRRAGKAFGYARLRVTHLLRAEVETGSSLGLRIAAALEARRTVAVPDTLAVIKGAINRSAARRFLLDGYPRVVSDGYPSVQDQVFGFEEAVGPIEGVVVLEAGRAARVSRVLTAGPDAVLTPGQERQLEASVETFVREKTRVLGFFNTLGKVVTVRRLCVAVCVCVCV